jgi:single-stranded-DNA-specific exonuclease
LPAARIAELETRFELAARSVLKPQDLEQVLRVDAEVSGAEVDWNLLEALERLAPFGCGNPTPVLATRDFRLMLGPRILQEKHLKLKVVCGPKSVDAIGWGMAERGTALAPGQSLDMAFSLDRNVFQGTPTLQLVVKDLR